MNERRNIIREAIAIALEGGPSGDLHMWCNLAKQRDALRKHVMRFVLDFAQARGVILEERDVTREIDNVIAELRGASRVP
ncbi:MAG TPA: hypothetical protein VIV58_09605 [Kofleriaceae bacterium]